MDALTQAREALKRLATSPKFAVFGLSRDFEILALALEELERRQMVVLQYLMHAHFYPGDPAPELLFNRLLEIVAPGDRVLTHGNECQCRACLSIRMVGLGRPL